jgi:hypothetical protein
MTWAHVASTVAFADGGAGAVVIGGRAAAPPLDDAELAGADSGLPPKANARTTTTGTATAVAMRALRRVRASMAYRYK